jgi:hypothetical protein
LPESAAVPYTTGRMSRTGFAPRPTGRRGALAALGALGWGLFSAPAAAVEPARRVGRPEVKLDRLVFPEGIPGGRELVRHLELRLRREARNADWGAPTGAKIEYRFFVEKLSIQDEGHVLRIACTALGRLPKGKSARSRIEYGGDPKKRTLEVKKVLDMVARGVITRLAELERERRLGRP